MTKDLIKKIEGQTGLTSTGWNLANITEEQWNDAGALLVKLDQARQWWLGDWWNACQWGNGKEACEDIGVNYQTAQDCGMVAKKIQFSRRRENLGFSHHREVCAIQDEAMQDKFLDWAEKEKATRNALREKVQEYLAMSDWSESEKHRRFDVEAGKTVVANTTGDQDKNLINWAKQNALYVFIGRGQYDLGWGNPYELNGDGDRQEVCSYYASYFLYKKGLHKKLDKLFGKVLGCYCYPEQCHGDHLAEKANLLTQAENWQEEVGSVLNDAI